PFGGNQRTIVVTVDPASLRAYDMSPEEVVAALAAGNKITPSGSLPFKHKAPMVPVNSVVIKPHDLEQIVLRNQGGRTGYLRGWCLVDAPTDIATGYGLVNGRRSVYILVTKRADASTLAVVDEVTANLPLMQDVLPRDAEGNPEITVRFVFDQSPYITRALW